MSKKQVIVMRKDLNMRKGKMCAQAAHASLKVVLDQGGYGHEAEGIGGSGGGKFFELTIDENLSGWLDGNFKKVCVSVDSEAELLDVVAKAKSAGIPCALITDSGLTEFNGVPTNTCCAVGPAKDSIIDSITGKLKLL